MTEQSSKQKQKSKRGITKRPNISLKAFLSDDDSSVLPSPPDQTMMWWKNLYKKPAAGHLGMHQVNGNEVGPSPEATSGTSYFLNPTTMTRDPCATSKNCNSRKKQTSLPTTLDPRVELAQKKRKASRDLTATAHRGSSCNQVRVFESHRSGS